MLGAGAAMAQGIIPMCGRARWPAAHGRLARMEHGTMVTDARRDFLPEGAGAAWG